MKAIELMKKTNFEDVCEAAKKYELTPTPKERYREIYDKLLSVEPSDSVKFLIVAPFEYPAEGAIETSPDVRIMTPGSRLRRIANTPLDILAGCELCEKSIESYGETDLAACILCEIELYSERDNMTVQTDKIAARLANDKDFRDSIIGADTPADRQCEARNRAVMNEYVISCLKSYEDMIVSGAVSDILHPSAVSST